MSHLNIDVSVLTFTYTSLAETTQEVAMLQQSCTCADYLVAVWHLIARIQYP
jgi:hypothetical protein